MNYDLEKPCGECPFRRASAPGWLGPWTVFELLMVIGHSAFACHRTVKERFNEDQPGLQSCAGMAIFLNNKMEVSRNASNRHHQDLLAKSPHAKAVFRNSTEFAGHHNLVRKTGESNGSRTNRRTRRATKTGGR